VLLFVAVSFRCICVSVYIFCKNGDDDDDYNNNNNNVGHSAAL